MLPLVVLPLKTPATSMPYEPFLLGVGVVFNFLLNVYDCDPSVPPEEFLDSHVMVMKCPVLPVSGGRGCLGEGRLGVPGQVWEFRFLLSFPSFHQESRSSRNVWENAWKSQTSFFQASAAF